MRTAPSTLDAFAGALFRLLGDVSAFRLPRPALARAVEFPSARSVGSWLHARRQKRGCLAASIASSPDSSGSEFAAVPRSRQVRCQLFERAFGIAPEQEPPQVFERVRGQRFGQVQLQEVLVKTF